MGAKLTRGKVLDLAIKLCQKGPIWGPIDSWGNFTWALLNVVYTPARIKLLPKLWHSWNLKGYFDLTQVLTNEELTYVQESLKISESFGLSIYVQGD